MTLVTLSASYGAAGSRIGPRLAERLEVPFIDRAIPLKVAEKLDVPLHDAAAHDERVRGSLIERLLIGFIGADTGAPSAVPADFVSQDGFRRATEEILLRQAATGKGVILGRMAMVLLRDHPGALRVRIDGPPERRIEQAMRLQGVDRDAAERGLRSTDRMHGLYARHFYGVDLNDISLYHLVIDSTAIPIEATVELIAHAAEAIAGPPRDAVGGANGREA